MSQVSPSYFFYDLETSGISPRDARIMQFAGQRTDMELKPIGEPVNLLVKLTPDIVPEPDAIMLTGITPQSTVADGLTEVEFLQELNEQVIKPNTIFLGFNTVRFDDRFMEFLFYRNFDDPYAWRWQDGCSRWDMLDLVRITRALRPDGIEWPVNPDGSATNRLELLTKVNGLAHDQAHDALSDVHATIAVAKLIRDKQPKLFNYMLNIRGKKDVIKLITAGDAFVYATGKYPKETLHTSAAIVLAEKQGKRDSGSFLIYDLRHDPTPFFDLTVDEIIEAWQWSRDPEKLRLPVKSLKANNCPAVSPLGVLDEAAQQWIKLDIETIQRNVSILKTRHAEFTDKLLQATAKMDTERDKTYEAEPKDCDTQIYEGFVSDADKTLSRAIRASKPDELMSYEPKLHDERLKKILPRYKARNYPTSLSSDERKAWDEFCYHRLLDGGDNGRLGKYFKRLEELAAKTELSENQRYLLEELQLYGESIMPIPDDSQAEE